MRSFNSSNMADDNLNTSQSNLQQQQQAALAQQQRADSLQELNEELATSQAGGRQRQPSATRAALSEMQPDLQYLAHEAPLDGGESTFGAAYSTLGQRQPTGESVTQITHSYSSTMTATRPHERDQENDYERADFRLDQDELNGDSTGQLRADSAAAIRQASSEALEQVAPDNVDIQRPLQQAGFLVSFMVDARGGAMRGCRHSGVRVIIPPGAAQQPMRITCRYLRRERLVHPPPLMEGEACASKIMEVGPAGAKFLGPVLIEVPHFASLRGREREIIILRSDSGEVWREHLVEADERLVADIIHAAELAEREQSAYLSDQENASPRPSSAFGGPDDVFATTTTTNSAGAGAGGDPKQQQQERRLTRIVTNEFPQYFAIISRIRQEVHTVGPEGSAVDSQVVPKVQAIFTEGALTKRIKIGLQAQSVPSELVLKLFGSLNAITFSPIVTIEPRRRKFHCPIKLKIPLPAGYRPETSANLRLLCSITGGQSKALWEDVTGSTPLSIHERALLFTTTVSARFWLVHCQRSQRCPEAPRFAQQLWRRLIQVPFMAKFVIFAKRRDISEANVRVFCMTDDKEDKTLEVQEHYTLVARSREVEVLDGQYLYLEFAGNLLPTHLSPRGRGAPAPNSSALINEQLAFSFLAFQENRLAFAVRLRELGQEPSGRIAFMEDSIKYLASLTPQQRDHLNKRRRRAVCTLGVQLPALCVHYDNILGTPKRNSYYATARIGDLTLADIAQELSSPASSGRRPVEASELELELDSLQEQRVAASQSSLLSGASAAYSSRQRRPDWMELAPKLGIPRDEVDFIAEHCGTGSGSGNGAGMAPALLLLMHWYRLAAPDDRDQDLARGLQAIGRDDIARQLNFPIEPKRISRSTMELLQEIEAIPVRSSENLHAPGSELSGYTSRRPADGGVVGSSRGSSLRRLDQNLNERDSFEEERRRRRADSASASSQPLREHSTSASFGALNDQPGATRKGESSTSYEREIISTTKTTIVESGQPSVSKSSKRQRRKRG